jgi:hypothetical protein
MKEYYGPDSRVSSAYGPTSAEDPLMRSALVGSTLLFGLLGCQHGLNQVCSDSRGGAEACPADGAPHPPPCPPKVEVQAPNEIEVRAPRQKIVVEVPPAAAPCPPPAAPCQPPVQPPTYPPMMPTPGYGQPVMGTAQMQERTGFGLMFDTMRIPLPILRPVAIPRPAEMKMTMPMAAAPMMPMMPMMPMPGAMMPGMAMGTPPTPMGIMQLNAQGSMSAAAMAAAMNPYIMQLAAQLQVSPEALVALLRAALAGSTAPASPPSQPPTGPQASSSTPLPGTPTTAAAPPPPASPPPPAMPTSAGTLLPPLGTQTSGSTAASLSRPSSAAPTTTPTVASLQEQLRHAEQRLRELEALRSRDQK